MLFKLQFLSLELNGKKNQKKALNSSVAFSDMMWVRVQLQENGDHGWSLSDWKGYWVLHMCPVWVSRGEPEERQKRCPYMIPMKNQPFCCLKTFYFEVHQYVPDFLMLSWNRSKDVNCCSSKRIKFLRYKFHVKCRNLQSHDLHFLKSPFITCNKNLFCQSRKFFPSDAKGS